MIRGKRNKAKKIKKFTHQMQAKTLLVFGVVLLLLLALVVRLTYLRNEDGERYSKKVLSQQTYSSSVIPYRRGDIIDRNGSVLATSIKVYNLILDPKTILETKTVDGAKTTPYREPTLQALTTYFDVNYDEVNQILTDKPTNQYTVLLKQLEYSEIKDFEEAMAAKGSKIQGVWFEEEYKRIYPNNTAASDIIGFTSAGNVGNWGIEQTYNSYLNGTNGREYGYFDNELNLERTVKPAVDGDTVVSTIDLNIQTIVEKHIDKFMKDIGAKNAAVIIMDPNNGEILAMASDKQYDLNDPFDLTKYYTKKEIKAMTEEERLNALYDIWKNFAIAQNYEPGSTFKPFVMAAALEEDIVEDGDHYYCDGKQTIVEGIKPIRCVNRSGHGDLTIEEAIMKSCNDVMMQVAAKMGRKTLWKYQTNYGFGRKTGIDLPGEEKGQTFAEEQLNAFELATTSFGQGLTVTMVQMASAMCATVNGGYYYTPHVVNKIQNAEGATVETKDAVLSKQVISTKTSDLLRRYLYNTVEEGTAKVAGVEGYSIGGKTGTAEKHTGEEGVYLVSFLGYAPYDNPQVVIYTIVDEVNDENQAQSSYALKLSHDIMDEIFPFLGILKDSTDDAKTASDDKSKKDDASTQTADDTTDTEEDAAQTEEESTKKEDTSSESSNEDSDEENDTENYNFLDDSADEQIKKEIESNQNQDTDEEGVE
ncbi:peptidoglycan D,D-transpeptidase FtsI family protein [Anaerosporobacter faecicola]|uniref:peptidoglycan D,D-transpeptidase FtsI family protein n=1 Tax=Anaerosporobacter faecicola TaxID=2718714 RepID=UPI00143A4578|nr:penicillin-binding transpeptidase domain-containing protein [Anaerosporobacter faecicola]